MAGLLNPAPDRTRDRLYHGHHALKTTRFMNDLELLMANADVPGISNPVEIGHRIRAIDAIDAKRKELNATKKAYLAWFQQEFDKLDQQVAFLKDQMYIYMKNSGRKSVKTPLGSVGITRRTRTVWPNEDILIGFSEEMGLPVKVTKSPDLKAVEGFIKETGNYPPGYDTEEYESVTIRKASAVTTEDEWTGAQ